MVNLFELFIGAYKHKEVKLNLAAVKGFRSTLRIPAYKCSLSKNFPQDFSSKTHSRNVLRTGPEETPDG